MSLSWIDWTMMIVAVIAIRSVSFIARNYMRGVSDFLAANRSAGRYLLTISGAMGNMGVISFISNYQMYMQAGFTGLWWGMAGWVTGPALTLAGWIYFRFRETRAMTLPQFLEMRYSRNFRVFAGIVVFTSGIINFAVMPAAAAWFFVYFFGWRARYYGMTLLGHRWNFPIIDTTLTLPSFHQGHLLFSPHHIHHPIAVSIYAIVMAIDLILALYFVTQGGQVSVMITECVQGMFSAFAILIIVGLLMTHISWDHVVAALKTAPPNASMLHPFHNGTQFSWKYYFEGLFFGIYSAMAWQGAAAFNSSGRTPHEQKMGGIIGLWRGIPQLLIVCMLPIFAFTVMHLPQYAAQADAVRNTLAHAGVSNDVKMQIELPVIINRFFPVGLKGLLGILLIFYSFTGNDTYMHSWGSIFVQDIVLPLRKKPVTTEQHIKLLRYSIVGVALFAFIFSLFYTPSQAIFFFFALTGAIWLGGAGAVLIGGLYTRYGTTAAAYAAVIVGIVCGAGGLIFLDHYKHVTGHDFVLNGQDINFLTAVLASLVYFLVTVFTVKKQGVFNLQRMLHRGPYADANQPVQKKPTLFEVTLGFTSDFTLKDKIWSICMCGWTFGWWIFFVVVTLISLVHPFSTDWWGNFWKYYIWINFTVCVPTVVIFTIGGFSDLKALFAHLKSYVRDHTDNGQVAHTNDDYLPAPGAVMPPTAPVE